MKLYLYQKCQKLNFDIYKKLRTYLQLCHLLNVVIADAVLLLHFA